MDYSSILKNISKHISLGETETDIFKSHLDFKSLNRREVLLKAGDVASHISYVESGALRAFYIDEKGNENIIMFAVHDWWITDMYSFASQKSALLQIDALTPSTIIQLSNDSLEKLYMMVPKFERFFRIIVQNAYVREQLRAIENLSLPAERRYLNFIQKYPRFATEIPLKQIASYLGITPEFLSVIRKKITLE